ncbi:hypothetical protein [Nostoc sp.]|uniref:hypothetical protein n=1 Tax=Nostoc sp. TaxID=1180 RepID=UPI003FA5F8E5
MDPTKLRQLRNPLGICEQDAEELEDERRWDEAFARSPDMLTKLATEAMAEYRAGKTQELDSDTL